MGRINSGFKCVLCNHGQVMNYKKPAFLSQSLVNVNCEKCKSKFLAAVKRVPRSDEVQYKFRCVEDNFINYVNENGGVIK